MESPSLFSNTPYPLTEKETIKRKSPPKKSPKKNISPSQKFPQYSNTRKEKDQKRNPNKLPRKDNIEEISINGNLSHPSKKIPKDISKKEPIERHRLH
jgi:hypothetical protein